VRPSLYEPGRANIVIFNWPLQASVAVDLSAAGIKPGDAFQIRDAENWYNGPVVSGTYTDAPVSVPMTGLTVVQPNGGRAIFAVALENLADCCLAATKTAPKAGALPGCATPRHY
jgi:hypothetical protein